MQLGSRFLTVACAAVVLQAAGCTLKATTDEIIDTTSNITGTTSSAHSWFTEDGQMNTAFKTTAFVHFNQDNLVQDLAAGRGEYLASISELLNVPGDRQPAFFSAAQTHYAQTTSRDASTPETLIFLLQETAVPFTHEHPSR